MQILLVTSNYNQQITSALQRACVDKLLASRQVTRQQIQQFWVAGAFEIPVVVATALTQQVYDCVICLGAIIKGETLHFEVLARAVAHALMQLSIKHKTPVIFEIITAFTAEQALARSGKGKTNKGEEAADAALMMVKTMQTLCTNDDVADAH